MDIYDYSPHLLAIQAHLKQLNESALKKDWDACQTSALSIATEAKLLLNWLRFCPVCNQRDAVRAKFDEESG